MTDLFNIELGRIIRAARGSRGVTQAALGHRIKLSRTSITNIECGRQRLLVDQLASVALALDMPISELLPPVTLVQVAREPSTEQSVSKMPTVQRYIDAMRQSERRKPA